MVKPGPSLAGIAPASGATGACARVAGGRKIGGHVFEIVRWLARENPTWGAPTSTANCSSRASTVRNAPCRARTPPGILHEDAPLFYWSPSCTAASKELSPNSAPDSSANRSGCQALADLLGGRDCLDIGPARDDTVESSPRLQVVGCLGEYPFITCCPRDEAVGFFIELVSGEHGPAVYSAPHDAVLALPFHLLRSRNHSDLFSECRLEGFEPHVGFLKCGDIVGLLDRPSV